MSRLHSPFLLAWQFLLTRLRDVLVPRYLNGSETSTTELEHNLRFLAFMGEYQEMLGPVLELNVLEMLLALFKKPCESVQFCALEFASRLIAHKSFALKFVQAGVVDVLLAVPTNRPIYLEASIAWCLSGEY